MMAFIKAKTCSTSIISSEI